MPARCIRCPTTSTSPPGSAFLTTYGTSWYALAERGQLKAGETLLVLGAGGGVGLAAVDIGRALGGRVLAGASSAAKLAEATRLGAEAVVDYSTDDLRSAITAFTEGKGVDVVYDPVGGPFSEQALRSTAWEGRFLVIGFAAGEIPKIPLNLALLKGCSIVGVFLGSRSARDPKGHRQSMLELIGHWERGELSPYVSQTFPLDQASEALPRPRRPRSHRQGRGDDLGELPCTGAPSCSNVVTREGRWSTRDW